VTAVVLRGDARALPLPDGCVDLVVTSPPFWQLRSYTDNGVHYDGQVGSEPTPREYIDSLLACTREWIRVLKPGGSLFVELGDKYTGSGGNGNSGLLTPKYKGNTDAAPPSRGKRWDYPPKTLLDLPHRYAIRCMDELGLILRAEIIWHHKNGLPESVTDRVRRAHSAVFHFTRLPRYYAAVDEIREPHTWGREINPEWHEARKQWGAGSQGRPQKNDSFASVNPLGKLPGSVWDIPSQPLTVPAHLGVDHFAAFPMELPRRCVLGWSPPGVCTACGEGRRPVVDRPAVGGFVPDPSSKIAGFSANGPERNRRYRESLARGDVTAITGYACACPQPDAPVRPALVLDPFGGTGTTALVAAAYGRTGISVDMSGDYSRLARWRTTDPAERAKAMMVAKPPPVPDGQASLFDDMEAS
jgi:site-specific DNA-methyltransferase (adenine-specific)